MRATFALCLILAAAPAGAQPYSQSMAECAGLFQAGATWMTRADRAARFEQAAAVWNAAAMAQAHAEGVSRPQQTVATFQQAKADEWQARGRMSVFSQDFKDWASYCRAFGRHMGIDTDPQ